MSAHIQERVTLPSFDDPILITAFATPFKGGATATFAVSQMLNQWDATPIAELEAEDCYHFGRLRPQVSRNGNRTSIQWPTTQIFAANPPGANRTFLLMLGQEPTQSWQSFASAVAQFALRSGVRTAINLHVLPASISHRQPAPVQAWYSDDGARQSFGLPEFGMQEGAADIGLAISSCLQELGCRTVDLFGLEPFYAPSMPIAQTAIALLEAIARPYGAGFDNEELRAIAERQGEALENIVAASPQLREGLQAIERHSSYTLGSGQEPSVDNQTNANGAVQVAEPLNTEDVLKDVEDWLRLGG
jgi:PAC2 family